eukprot:80335-Pyramimonas_sp.AAC.1
MSRVDRFRCRTRGGTAARAERTSRRWEGTGCRTEEGPVRPTPCASLVCVVGREALANDAALSIRNTTDSRRAYNRTGLTRSTNTRSRKEPLGAQIQPL